MPMRKSSSTSRWSSRFLLFFSYLAFFKLASKELSQPKFRLSLNVVFDFSWDLFSFILLFWWPPLHFSFLTTIATSASSTCVCFLFTEPNFVLLVNIIIYSLILYTLQVIHCTLCFDTNVVLLNRFANNIARKCTHYFIFCTVQCYSRAAILSSSLSLIHSWSISNWTTLLLLHWASTSYSVLVTPLQLRVQCGQERSKHFAASANCLKDFLSSFHSAQP